MWHGYITERVKGSKNSNFWKRKTIRINEKRHKPEEMTLLLTSRNNFLQRIHSIKSVEIEFNCIAISKSISGLPFFRLERDLPIQPSGG
jgi:hypothetical protein